MADTRFILAGTALIFAGVLVFGVFGQDHRDTSLESSEFGTCYEYFDDSPPEKINCSYKMLDQAVFFGSVIALVAAGGVSLVKGIRGDWDSRVKREDVAGPGGDAGGGQGPGPRDVRKDDKK